MQQSEIIQRAPTPITQFGDPVLRLVAAEVSTEEIVSPEVQELIEEMAVSLRAARGIGLAAPQIGVSKRIFIVEIPESNRVGYGHTPETPLTVVINPRIVLASAETRRAAEACLSIRTPDGRGVYEGVVERPERVVVEGQDREGNPIVVDADKLLSRAVQHEIDHLDGILFTDRIKEAKDLRIVYPVENTDPVFERNANINRT